MKNPVRSNILKVKPYVPGKPIEEVERELGLKDVIKLASNENCLGPSPKALEALKVSLKNINRYPDASGFYLKRRLARYLKVNEDNLIIGNGSDEIITLAIRTFVNEGEKVVIARPTFLIYEIASEIQNAKAKFIPLTGELGYDLKAMKDAVTIDTKLIFIANPDNPTGSYVTKYELDEFFDGLPESVIVFLDEAYFEFGKDSFGDYPNGLDYIDRPNVIISRSFSKAYGLAGLRIGYGVSNAEFIGYMERVREPFNANLLAQVAACAALDDTAFLKRTLEHVKKEKASLYKFFDNMKLEYVPSATNFILVNVKRDCKEVFNGLLKKGVIVRDMKAWGLSSYIRVTVGTREENRRFVEALKEVIR